MRELFDPDQRPPVIRGQSASQSLMLCSKSTIQKLGATYCGGPYQSLERPRLLQRTELTFLLNGLNLVPVCTKSAYPGKKVFLIAKWQVRKLRLPRLWIVRRIRRERSFAFQGVARVHMGNVISPAGVS